MKNKKLYIVLVSVLCVSVLTTVICLTKNYFFNSVNDSFHLSTEEKELAKQYLKSDGRSNYFKVYENVFSLYMESENKLKEEDITEWNYYIVNESSPELMLYSYTRITDVYEKSYDFYKKINTEKAKSLCYFGKNGRKILDSVGIKANPEEVFLIIDTVNLYDFVYYKTNKGDYVLLKEDWENNSGFHLHALYLFPINNFVEFNNKWLEKSHEWFSQGYIGGFSLDHVDFDLSPYAVPVTDEIISQCGYVPDETDEINWREIE